MITHDVADYVTWNIPHPQYYIQDLLTKEGTMLVYGAPGVKKSWLVQHLGYSLACGVDWLGFRIEPARTLLVNFEISATNYHWRLRLMSSIFTLPEQMLYVASPSYFFLEDRNNFNHFAETIRPIAPQVIILDCLSGCFGGDENSSQEMSGFIRNIIELKQEHQAAVVLVHHSNKNLLAVSPMDRARGHTKLTGWVDSILYMVNQPTGTQIQFGKTRNSLHILRNLNIRFVDYNWELVGRREETVEVL